MSEKLDRSQNVQNFEPSNFDSIKFFDYLHGLAAKWIKPDDELKKKKIISLKSNFINNLNNLITLI